LEKQTVGRHCAVQFDWNQGQFYVDRQTFLASTRKASAEEKKA
jgi:hypothetical protein